MLHDFTYTPDAGRALAAWALTNAANGRTWHLPTSIEVLTGIEWVRLACEKAAQPVRFQVIPNGLLKPCAWFVPPLRDTQEVMHQLQNDYGFDSRKIQTGLGLRGTWHRRHVEARLDPEVRAQ